MVRNPFLIAPSLLSADFARLGEEVGALARAGADWIHVDVMDGHFVPNLTIGAGVVKALRPITPLPLDVHLMIEEPLRFVEAFARAGADYITVHVEACGDVGQTLMRIRDSGAKPGVTLRPGTPIKTLLPHLPLVDLVLVMTVEPGFGGQRFMADQVPKLRAVRDEARRLGRDLLIEVDGGVTAETARTLGEADVLVAGSYVFSGDYASTIERLRAVPRE